jgi:hypothetical protein
VGEIQDDQVTSNAGRPDAAVPAGFPSIIDQLRHPLHDRIGLLG